MKAVGVILLIIGIFSIPNSIEVLFLNESFAYKIGYILPTILCIWGGVSFIKRSKNK